MPPAFQRREQHEQVDRAVALIFVVMPGWLSWFCRNRHAGFLDELFRCFIQADDGSVWIMRPLIDLQFDLPWTTSPAEGQINRLKMLKRTMYGRAGFDLLRARVLHAA